jgi:translation initiation factor 2B subunit (eIF-2B alpha/beta/delta family)
MQMGESLGELNRRIATLGADRTTGASGILAMALEILAAAKAADIDRREVTEALCRAQPTMASVWNASAAALSDDPARLTQFAERVRRAPEAIARYAAGLFADDERPLHVVSVSCSGSVVVAINAIRAARPVRVSCSESRPALEGRRLAAELAASGIPVSFFTDAAIANALSPADFAANLAAAHARGGDHVVLVGADAIAPTWFLNKAGTRMLSAAATQQGVPVYVVASRDKFVGRDLAARLVIRSGEPAEVWDSPPESVDVRNPYFELIPLDLVTAVISDVGILGTGMIPDVCEH